MKIECRFLFAVTKEAAPATVFGEGVYWKTLVPNKESVSDPSEGTDFHAPTVGAEEVPIVKKRNFSATFDRQPFIAHRNVDIVDRFKRRKLDPQTKKVMQEKEAFVTGGPTAEFLSDNNLDHTSLPHEWFEPFVPRSLTSLWTKYTNTKALMDNAGNIGEIYPDFYPFTPNELRKHLGLYIVHGLAPSPEVSMKFKSQSEDDINGNNFVNRSLGPQAVRRHKHFRRFFATQNPLLRPPSTKDSPNWKVDSFLKWIIKISTKAWRLSQKISVDEQTIGFQGRHVSKLRITYKNEGDGFQCDALCNDGYTFTFYFHHEPSPVKYTSI